MPAREGDARTGRLYCERIGLNSALEAGAKKEPPVPGWAEPGAEKVIVSLSGFLIKSEKCLLLLL